MGYRLVTAHNEVFCFSDIGSGLQLSSASAAEDHVMEAGVRIGDVYALLVGEQCCLHLLHLSLRLLSTAVVSFARRAIRARSCSQ